MLQVNWNRCQGNNWCSLNSVDLSHNHFDSMAGVYVIWHGGQNPATVRIGQGIIRDRLTAHRNDDDVQAYANQGLYVTWASVSSQHRDSVEVYLGEKLKPLVGERFPDVRPIEVNLPW